MRCRALSMSSDFVGCFTFSAFVLFYLVVGAMPLLHSGANGTELRAYGRFQSVLLYLWLNESDYRVTQCQFMPPE